MTNQKLPVFQVIIDAYKVTFKGSEYLARLTWAPFVFCGCVYFPLMVPFTEEYLTKMDFAIMLAVAFLALISFLSSISASVKWHQFILRSQRRVGIKQSLCWPKESWPYLIEGTAFYALYFGGGLGLYIVAGLFVFPEILETTGGVSGPQSALSAGAVAAAILPFILYVLVLPSVAVGKRLSFRQAKDRMSGNVMRVWLVCVSLLLSEALMLHFSKYLGSEGDIGLYLVSVGISTFFFWATLSTFSITYRWFEAQPAIAPNLGDAKQLQSVKRL